MQKMRLRPGLRPGPHWGAHNAPPDLLVGSAREGTPLPRLHPTRRLDCPLHIISGYATAVSSNPPIVCKEIPPDILNSP